MGSSAKAAHPPCHENAPTIDNSSLMFMTDCMKLDLQSSGDSVEVNIPDFDFEFVTYSLINTTLNELQYDQRAITIRAPPYKPLAYETNTSVILSTQRFRN